MGHYWRKLINKILRAPTRVLFFELKFRPINSCMSDIDQLVNEIRLATDYQVNKRILREKIQTDLQVTHAGGLFKVTPELIAFLNSWDTEELFLEDTYNNPIKVNRNEFLELCKQHYQMVMNTWHIQHEEIRRARKV